jgi:hypothetical protein
VHPILKARHSILRRDQCRLPDNRLAPSKLANRLPNRFPNPFPRVSYAGCCTLVGAPKQQALQHGPRRPASSQLLSRRALTDRQCPKDRCNEPLGCIHSRISGFVEGSAPGFDEFMRAGSVREGETNVPLSSAEDEEIQKKHSHAVIYKEP